MNYAKIIMSDVANGPGVRVSLFVSGCTHRCNGCFNQKAWDFNYGKQYTVHTHDAIMAAVERRYISGLSILGGDPFCQDAAGIKALTELCAAVKAIGKSVWVWTGSLWEDIRNSQILNYVDVLVDGPDISEMHDPAEPWVGSTNQRIIDAQESLRLEDGWVCLWNGTSN